MKARLLDVLEWLAAIALIIIILAFIFIVSTAHATEGTVGQYTVGQYRLLSESMKSSFIAGVMGVYDHIGQLRCQNPATVGVMMAWLESQEVQPTENVYDAVLHLSVVKHGCVSHGGRPNL